MGRLTVKQVQNEKKVGRYGDGVGHGLALSVKQRADGGVTKSWLQRLTIGGRSTTIGLGSIDVVSLAEAREAAQANWLITKKGGDPRRPTHEPTFREAAETVITDRKGVWKDGGKSEGQWIYTFENFAFPVFGDKLVSEVTTHDVREALKPIWHEKHETAERLRARISTVLNWAISEGHRIDDPARKRSMDSLGKVQRPRQHQRSLPHQQVGAALDKIHKSGSKPLTKLALEFLTLTACRSGEVRGCRWTEIDFNTATWTIPGSRTKTKESHRVALSRRAVGILRAVQKLSDGNELVFPGPKGGQMSDGTLSKVMNDLDLDGTPHGMRASFRTWAADAGKDGDLAEFALGHRPTGVVAAYSRSDLLERRRPLMQAWADYLVGQGPKIPRK